MGLIARYPAQGRRFKRRTMTTADPTVAREAFFEPTPPSQTIVPSGIASAEAFGSATVAVLTVATVAPSSIPSAEAFGSPTLTQFFHLFPTSIESEETFGEPFITGGTTLGVHPVAIPSAEAFGTPTLTQTTEHLILPTGIPSAEVFGTPRVRLVAPVVDDVHPRVPNSFYNPLTFVAYYWDVNHSAEGETPIGRNSEITSRNPQVNLVRQQSSNGPLVLTLTGTMLTETQRGNFIAFFNDCEDTAIEYGDASGDAYRVLIRTFDARRVRSTHNPLTATGIYWTFSLELEVLDVLSGPLAAVVA